MKILFISHEASLTGAPLYLLHICKYLKQHTNWELYFLLKFDGPLRKDFEALGNTYVYNCKASSKGILSKIKNKISNNAIGNALAVKSIIKQLKSLNLDLIYSNTATNGHLLESLSALKVKIVTHVHELEWAINSFGPTNEELVKRYTNYYVSTSPSVTNYVKKRFTLNNVFEFKCFPIHSKPVSLNNNLIKSELGIANNSFVVGASGTVEWRKGWDLFVKLAWEVKQLCSNTDIYFIWVGRLDPKIKKDVEHEIMLSGLQKNVFFIGHKLKPLHYYSILDVFCLMSREEAFGIVAIENALFGTPVICFDVAEGLASFVQQDAGFVIPYPDTKKMAEHIIELKQNTRLKNELGKTALKKVEIEHNLNYQGERLINYLKTIA